MRTTMPASLLAMTIGFASCGGTEHDESTRGPTRDTSLAGNSDPPSSMRDSAAVSPDRARATARMRSASGRDIGTLTLTDAGQGIVLTGRLTGLPPGGHAIHLHAVGKCDPPAFKAAGGHWNPTNRQHGSESSNGPHLGDLLNLSVEQDSSVTVQATTPGGTLRGDDALGDADGAALIVHAGVDDYRSQPSGGAGERIACGVVTGS